MIQAKKYSIIGFRRKEILLNLLFDSQKGVVSITPFRDGVTIDNRENLLFNIMNGRLFGSVTLSIRS